MWHISQNSQKLLWTNYLLVKLQILLASSKKWRRNFFRIETYWSAVMDIEECKNGGRWKYNNQGKDSSVPLVLGTSVGLRRFDYFVPIVGRLLAGFICANWQESRSKRWLWTRMWNSMTESSETKYATMESCDGISRRIPWLTLSGTDSPLTPRWRNGTDHYFWGWRLSFLPPILTFVCKWSDHCCHIARGLHC